MLQFLAWYLLVSLLGWLTFPLAYRLFPALADRGFSLARTLGMLVWGFAFWLMASLGIIQNDGGGLLLALVVLAAVSASGLLRKEKWQELGEWIRSNARLVTAVEILFFLGFAVWSVVRASNPNIDTAGGEKTMELAFINAILRSPTFPPHDPWLSGYAISYYYFGYVMTAMLARATGTLGTVAHNLMSALVFALSLIGAYGIISNLLAVWRKHDPSAAGKEPSTGLPLLGPLFLLFVSNLEGFLEVLSSRGLFWKLGSQPVSAFWSWLGIKNLVDPPLQPLSWIPHRFIWWWQASRVIQDYDLSGGFREIIDEFPAFSYLLGDLHPHVLAMPFGLMAVAVALNLFLGGWDGETNLYFYKLPVRPEGLFFGALILGGLAFLNTWDILIGFALVVGAYVLVRAMTAGWTWRRLTDLFALSLPMGLLAIMLYLPFYAGFQSQAGGILPNLDSPTRGAHLWVMFAPLFLALTAYLVYLWRSEKRPASWKAGFSLAALLAFLLWLFSWALAYLAYKLQPGFVTGLIDSQCSGSVVLCFILTTGLRFKYLGGLLTLLSLLGATLAFLIKAGGGRQPDRAVKKKESLSPLTLTPAPFILLLILLGSLLVIAPEFVFLRDLFMNRMNTIFKFYYQAWLLWSLASAFGVAVLLEHFKARKTTFLVMLAALALIFISINQKDTILRGLGWILAGLLFVIMVVVNRRQVGGILFHTGLAVGLGVALVYPVLGLANKADNFQIPAFLASLQAGRTAGDPNALAKAAGVWTLDGALVLEQIYPDDTAAARWLATAPAGVVAEAVGDSYSDYARFAAYSGQPDVVGWPWHEVQWRGSFDEQFSPIQNINCASADGGPRKRSDDMRCLYETSSWKDASTILAGYNVRYVAVGTLERLAYHLNDKKFEQHLTPVFQQGDVVIYVVP